MGDKYFGVTQLNKILDRTTVKYNFLQILFALNKSEKQVQHLSDTVKVKYRSGVRTKVTKGVGKTANGIEGSPATFTEKPITAPRFRNYTPLTAEWAYQVVPEGAGDGNTKLEDIIIKNISKEQSDILKLHSNTHELMISQILQNHKINIPVEGGTNFTLDFEPPEGYKEDLSNTDWAWNKSKSKLEFIRNKESKLTKYGYLADTIILGIKAAQYFLNDEEIFKKLDNRNIELGKLKLQGLEVSGQRYIGRLEGKDIYVYEGTYNDGEEKYYIDPNNFIMTSSTAPFTMHFSAIYDMAAVEKKAYIQKYFSKSWVEELSGARYLLVETDSTPAIEDAAAIYCAKVLSDDTPVSNITTLTIANGAESFITDITGTVITIATGVTRAQLKLGLIAPVGGTYELQNASGDALVYDATEVASTNKVVVTAEDGITTATYTITIS